MPHLLKLIMSGVCHLLVLLTFALLLVVLSENRLVHRVLASTASSGFSELNSDRIVLATETLGSFVGKKEPLAQDDPNEVQRTYIAFKGLPYASPPIGELRWKPPQPQELKRSPTQAAEFKPPCSQWSSLRRKTVGTPDCLYLNVYIPHLPFRSKRPLPSNSSLSPWTIETPNLLPVLVYIHGGEFISGSASQYSPDAIMKRERCLLVTLNYRLGVFGFLSTGTPELPGNLGLLDQLSALSWIRKHIHIFGGNPLRVTIFGSVEHLLLASNKEPYADLFYGAIITPQSTSILTPFPQFEDFQSSENFFMEFGAAAGCKNADAAELYVNGSKFTGVLECLQMLDTDTLIRTQSKMLTFHNLVNAKVRANPIGPVVDGVLLEERPEVLFRQGRFAEVPILIGLSANEGFNPFLEFYLKLYRKYRGSDVGQEESTGASGGMGGTGAGEKCDLKDVLAEDRVKGLLKSVVQTVMSAVNGMERNGAFDRVFESVWKYYFGGLGGPKWGQEIEMVVQKLMRLFGDMLVTTGHCSLVQALSAKSKKPVYAYVFSHGITHFAEFFNSSRALFEKSEASISPKRPKRSLHMTLEAPWEEAYYLFYPVRSLENTTNSNSTQADVNVDGNTMSSNDTKMTDALVKIWLGFARHQDPKQATQELPGYGAWDSVEPGHRSQNYYFISNSALQNGMRSDYRKAECQFWMNTVPQIRKLSMEIQDLEPFPILFWSSVAVVVLFALIIVTLIVLIVCVKHRSGSYGGEEIHLNRARYL